MRRILKKHSTKPERIVYEILKELHIPFKHRWLIKGMEVDFVINKICIEIDGHQQNTDKNVMLANLEYIPIHLHNSEVNRNNIINLIKKLKI